MTRYQEQAPDRTFNITLHSGHDTSTGLQVLEAKYIEHVYHLAKHNQSKAARMLGISRGNLRTKLAQYFPDTYL